MSLRHTLERSERTGRTGRLRRFLSGGALLLALFGTLGLRLVAPGAGPSPNPSASSSDLQGSAPAAEWPTKGRYELEGWGGPSLGVEFAIPDGSGPGTPILIVVPGAKRNADDYRDDWQHLAEANGFIVLALEATREKFPSEYDYNAGGVVDDAGRISSKKGRLDSAIEPLFDDFRQRYGSRRESYSLYGHSAGGGFVHRFLLFVPEARVDRAVAANPAFFTMPDESVAYPFGLASAGLPDGSLQRWFGAKLVIMLGEKDVGPRTQPLSNGPAANSQGPSVFARGLSFQRAALGAASERGLTLAWLLEIVPYVGHSDTHMASHAVKHLFGD